MVSKVEVRVANVDADAVADVAEEVVAADGVDAAVGADAADESDAELSTGVSLDGYHLRQKNRL